MKTNSKTPEFGGDWTKEKLNVLERYLDAYTTALKNKNFELRYIDAFAGSGWIKLSNDADAENFVRGSAQRAIEINNKPFDKLIFVERDSTRCAELKNLRERHPERKMVVINAEANDFLSSLNEDWHKCRGVLFLDPFGVEVEWSTIKKIASYEALDTWILFPTSAIMRMLPLSKRPDEIEPQWAERLTKAYGDESWRNLYKEHHQKDVFGEVDVKHLRKSGIEGLLSIYKEKLSDLFDKRFLDKTKTLKNSQKTPLFEFIFCVGHPGGIKLAKKIAKHILDHI